MEIIIRNQTPLPRGVFCDNMSLETRSSTTAMTPQEFLMDYSDYYQFNDSDSPEAARKQLIRNVIDAARQKLVYQDTVTILNLGAGKQILESEMQEFPEFEEIRKRLVIITLDIAKQLYIISKQ